MCSLLELGNSNIKQIINADINKKPWEYYLRVNYLSEGRWQCGPGPTAHRALALSSSGSLRCPSCKLSTLAFLQSAQS